MKKSGMKGLAVATCVSAAIVAALTGCGAKPATKDIKAVAGNAAVGSVLLSINPEIELEYNKAGLITEVEAKNDDGREVVADTKKYEGRSVSEVAAELVADIHAHGFFDKKVDGHDKNIVLKLEPGSGVPSADFLKGIEAAVEAQTSGFGLTSDAVVIDRDMESEGGLIGLEAAKDIAMAQMGLDHATFADHKYELDDGIYEFKFIADGVVYEYEIDGKTGKVLEADIEHNDDWDDEDSWDDLNDDTYDADDRDDPADTPDADDPNDADDPADAPDPSDDADDADDDPDADDADDADPADDND